MDTVRIRYMSQLDNVSYLSKILDKKNPGLDKIKLRNVSVVKFRTTIYAFFSPKFVR